MDAMATKARAERTAKAAPPITLNDVLVTVIFFCTIAYLTLRLIFAFAP